MDLVAARSTEAATVALAGLQGKLAAPLRQLRATCLDLLAEIEARLDFADDLPPLDESEIVAQLDDAVAEVQQILATADRGQLLRTGLKVAIVGRPNVGKSSLLNAWSRCDRAIVTDLPGTTRDVVESQLVVGGIPIQVLDTAGIRETQDVVERLGVERSRQAAQSADVILFVIAADEGWLEADQAIYDQVQQRPLIIVLNKIDRLQSLPQALAELPAPLQKLPCVPTAVTYHQGIDHLEQAILEGVHAGQAQAANLDLAINQRQAAALTQAQLALAQVKTTIAQHLPLDFWTIDLRVAIQALGEVLGEDATEAVLDRIFSRFCIGK
jgi:tRNA modification GTPase